MLLQLKVKDLGIIDEIDWSLSPGLNVITGETGAGKSLVIDAVEALLEGKVDEESIRHGASEARIEGIFTLSEFQKVSRLKELLTETGLESEDSLVISCELRRQGRTVSRVNGRAVPRGLLHRMGRLLVDIHGQSEHLSLLDNKYHLDFLDAYAHTLNMRAKFSNKAVELYRIWQELKTLMEQEKELGRREEFLRFQVEEIERAKLQPGEEEELEKERRILASAEKLKVLVDEAYRMLSGEDSRTSAPALDRLNQTVSVMKRLVELDTTLKPQLNFLEETVYGLEEAVRDIRSYRDRLEYNPSRLDEIESRLELIKNLKRKYGQTIAEIFDYRDKAEKELEGVFHSSERRTQLEAMRSQLKQEMGQIARELSRARSKAAKKLVTEVARELQELGMSQVKFEVFITQEEASAVEGIPLSDGKSYVFNNEGIDNVEFMVSTNPGEPMKPLVRIASTGEISRFTLALKGALSEADSIPILIFDEIDIGVGGRSGEIIGKKLWSLARNHQVICVTHLPQIAAFADAHYVVHKDRVGSRTVSKLRSVQGESRIEELAIMLAGPKYTATSEKEACELVQKAEAWKSAQ